MKVASRFTVAVHTLLVIYFFRDTHKTTSEFIAGSVNVNPVVIRRILLALKGAGIIEVKAGSGGASVIKKLSDITLYDIYRITAGEDNGMFGFHEKPNPACPVGRNIHAVLDGRLDAAQNAMERELKKTTFADLVKELEKRTSS